MPGSCQDSRLPLPISRYRNKLKMLQSAQMPISFAFVCTGSSGCGDIVFVFFILLPILCLLIISAFIWAILSFIKRGKPVSRKSAIKISFGKIFLLLLILCSLGLLFFAVLPTVVSDYAWRKKQGVCAQKAGYVSPADDNSTRASAESQTIFRSCLYDE